MANTPSLYASGKWVLLSPWTADPNVTYTCHAIRTFEDIEKIGDNVYERFYKPYIQEGVPINGTPFSFATERAKKPNIITLISGDNRIIYVPDTFIGTFPNASEIVYNQVVVAVPLGLLPTGYDVTYIKSELVTKVKTLLGVDVVPTVGYLPTLTNPSYDEHQRLESNRVTAIRNTESTETLLIKERERTTSLQARVDMLEDLLRQNGLLQ